MDAGTLFIISFCWPVPKQRDLWTCVQFSCEAKKLYYNVYEISQHFCAPSHFSKQAIVWKCEMLLFSSMKLLWWSCIPHTTNVWSCCKWECLYAVLQYCIFTTDYKLLLRGNFTGAHPFEWIVKLFCSPSQCRTPSMSTLHQWASNYERCKSLSRISERKYFDRRLLPLS